MKIAIVINAARITPDLENKLNGTDLINKHHIEYDLFLVQPQNIEMTLVNLNHQSYNAYIIGGGDGTVRTAIQVLVDKELPLAILPLGTFNLLANSLSHPNDIDALFAMIKNNKTKKIDLAEVNGNVIINHAWIGFYYAILKIRKRNTAIFEKQKLLKMIFNVFHLFKDLPLWEITISTDSQTTDHKTYLVYIGNNEFSTSIFDFGERKCLTSGLLSVVILNCHTKWQLFCCMVSSLMGNFKNSQYIHTFSAEKISIRTTKSPINIVVDGELFSLSLPLDFIVHQKQLTVMLP